MIDGLGRVFYYVVSRAKTLVDSVKKVTQPKYVIIFTIAYPYIYKNIKYILDVIPQVVVNLAEQLYSWIQSTFWGIYNYIVNNVNLGPLTGPVAGLVAGMAMAYPYLFYLFMKHILSFFVWVMAQIALNVMGAIAYIFCNVVIPAIKYIAGGYLFWKFLPHTFRYIGRALDRFGRGSLSGALGALAATLTPLAGFTLGYTVVSMLTDPACSYLGSPFVNLGYAVPYISYTPYGISLPDSMSAIGNLLTGYGYVIPSYYLTDVSYLENLIIMKITYLLSTSYIYSALSVSVSPVFLSYISNLIYLTSSPYGVYLPYYTPYGFYYYSYYVTPFYVLTPLSSYISTYLLIYPVYSWSYINTIISIPFVSLYAYEVPSINAGGGLVVNEISSINVGGGTIVNEISSINIGGGLEVYELPSVNIGSGIVLNEVLSVGIGGGLKVYELPSVNVSTGLVNYELPSINIGVGLAVYEVSGIAYYTV